VRPNTNLTRPERLQRVLELLERRDSLQVSELSEVFSVSEVTVRQDLAELAREGRVARVRGGVRALQRGDSELAFDVRLRLQVAEKRAIARTAAAMVGDGEAVALDSSTTAYNLALELRGKRELVVVTNGLLIAAALADTPGISVVVTGGVLRLPAMSVVGDLAVDVLRSTRIAKGFFGARGLSVDRGLMDLNPDEVRIKREMAGACERVIGIFDRTKWHRTALLSFVQTERVDAIVTDDRAPRELVEEWREHDVDVVTAEPRPGLRPVERLPALRRIPPGTEGPGEADASEGRA
jgi:DeoR/GlpR family transcriptional regulator of sugar metabolism